MTTKELKAKAYEQADRMWKDMPPDHPARNDARAYRDEVKLRIKRLRYKHPRPVAHQVSGVIQHWPRE